MPPAAFLFVDESGNSGVNYLDAAQPFYVSAGFLIQASRVPEMRRAIQAFLRPGEVELKAERILRRPAGQRRAVDIIKAVGKAGAVPLFIVMDKWFSVAGKLVDVFLDPEHNPGAAWLPTSAVKRRTGLVELLSDVLSESALRDFAACYHTPDVTGFQNTVEHVAQELLNASLWMLAHTFLAATTDLPNLVEQETYDRDGTHAQWASLNVPALGHLLRRADVLMDSKGTYSVVHDETSQFRPVIEHAVAAMRRPGTPAPDLFLEDGLRHRQLLRNLECLTFVRSNDEVCLQAADLLAGSIARVARNASGGDPLTEEMAALGALTFPALLVAGDGGPDFAGMYAREETMARVIARVIEGRRGR